MKKKKVDWKRWYDTEEGIKQAIKTLRGLIRLKDERHEAGYKRHERMNEFYILGAFQLDTCGNFMSPEGKAICNYDPYFPTVVSCKEGRAILAARIGDFSLCFNSDPIIVPNAKLCCPRCGEKWSLENCLDAVSWKSEGMLPLSEFVGRPLSDVVLAKDPSIFRFFHPDLHIRNEKYIDLSPKYPNPKNEWEKGVVKNEKGWINAADMSYLIQEGDEILICEWRYYHVWCNKEELRENYEERFRKIFMDAGIALLKLVSIPNKYCLCERCAPWFIVKTTFEKIIIGWRKRVINIDWSGISDADGVIDLFVDEDVTKGKNFIHACGWEKAQEYLQKIRIFCEKKD